MTWEKFLNAELLNMTNVFLVCAIVGGGLFILRSIMMLVGLGDDADHHDAADGDVSGSEGSPVAALKLVTIHGLTAFLLMFGLTGFLMLRNNKEAVWGASVVAAVVGVVTMFIIAKIFQSSRKLQSDGTIYPKDMVGVEGSIYLVIRPGGIGKVQLTVRNALKVFDARAKDPATEIKTGERVKVVEAGDVLIVEKV